MYTKQETTGLIFNFKCYGESLEWNKLLLIEGKINKDVESVCPPGRIRIAYNNVPRILEVDENGRMKKYSRYKSLGNLKMAEALPPFFASQNLNPVWTDCHGNWGTVDKKFGNWSGAVGEVKNITILNS